MNKRIDNRRHTVDMLFVIALLFLFAMGALMLIALGSSIYKRSVTTLAVDYVTYLYEYDGSLMELFARADVGNLLPESGQRIMDIENLVIARKADGILVITITLPGGDDLTFITAKRSGTGEN